MEEGGCVQGVALIPLHVILVIERFKMTSFLDKRAS